MISLMAKSYETKFYEEKLVAGIVTAAQVNTTICTCPYKIPFETTNIAWLIEKGSAQCDVWNLAELSLLSVCEKAEKWRMWV